MEIHNSSELSENFLPGLPTSLGTPADRTSFIEIKNFSEINNYRFGIAEYAGTEQCRWPRWYEQVAGHPHRVVNQGIYSTLTSQWSEVSGELVSRLRRGSMRTETWPPGNAAVPANVLYFFSRGAATRK